jgi:DNA segregation ATPase FtsK/SpoIIIE-like protein
VGGAWRHLQVPVLSAGALGLVALVGWAVLWPLWPATWCAGVVVVAAVWQFAPRGPERTTGVPLVASGALVFDVTWAWGPATPVLVAWAVLAALWSGLWLAYGPLLARETPAPATRPTPAAGDQVGDVAEPASLSMPTTGLLAPPPPRSRARDAELANGAAAITAKLGTFGVSARVVDIDQGPTVVRYVVEIPPDVAVAKVLARQRDIALALAATSLRVEAPIPGRSAIGFEVPARQRQNVTLRAVLEADDPALRALRLGLGWGISCEAVLADLAEMPHLLVAGATGQGKSVCVNALICSLLLQHSPDTLRLALADPKRVELRQFAGLPHLARPVALDVQQATDLLRWAVAEMQGRYRALERANVRDVAAHNARRPGAALPYLVVVIDELADLMMASRAEAQAERRAGCEVEELVVRLAQLGRAAGVHLVLATQRPSVDVVTGLIKANVPARIALAVSSGTDSRVVLDDRGAERLLGRGDMLYRPAGGAPVRLQGAYVGDAEVAAVVRHWTAQGGPAFDVPPADDQAPAGPATFDELMRGLLARAAVEGEGVRAEELVKAAGDEALPSTIRRGRATVYAWLREHAEDAGHGLWRERPA